MTKEQIMNKAREIYPVEPGMIGTVSEPITLYEQAAYLAGYTKCEQDMAGDAVRFVKWLTEHPVLFPARDGVKYSWVDAATDESFTYEQLYELFKNRK